MINRYNLKNFNAKAQYENISNPLEMRAWLDLVILQMEAEYNAAYEARVAEFRKSGLRLSHFLKEEESFSKPYMEQAHDVSVFRTNYEFDAGDARNIGRLYPSSAALFVDDLKDIKKSMAADRVLAFKR